MREDDVVSPRIPGHRPDQPERRPPLLLPEVFNLDQMVRESVYTCRDENGKVYPRHKTFIHSFFDETDSSNGPIFGLMCPRCGYWAGTLEMARTGGPVVGRWEMPSVRY